MRHIVAHGDLDGLTSAAILYDVLVRRDPGTRVSLSFAQPFNLHEALLRLEHAEGLRELYIVDVGLDEATWPRSRDSLARMLGRGVRVVWIDHHMATVRRALELASIGITLVATVTGSAATIMREAFVPHTSDPGFFEKLAIMGEVGDKIRRLDPGDPLAPVVEAVGSSLVANITDDEFKRHLIRMWVTRRELLDDEVTIRAEEACRKLEELIREAKEKVVYTSEKIIIIDLRGVRVWGFVGKVGSHYANRTGKVTFILFSVNPEEVVLTCRVPPERRFNAGSELPRLAFRLGGGGGGHEKAASIRVPSTLVEKLIEEVKGLEGYIG